ncbi:MAG TPA: Co2+/Mg2+ efflux protein ApaG [Burkholderiales bacterium]|nr:Co2+/Mg2+ efflux protein ApaG [Burkholderiales bacterium]
MDAPKAAYRAVTRQIEVTATPRFLPERSSPENGYFFWAYTITLTNRGAETVQLKTRHWRITDALGRLQEVRGAGVIGEEPVLKPGENFEYTSGVPLPTPSGFMTGTYGMVTAAGEQFDIDIPAFSLDTPQRANDQLTRSHEVGRRHSAAPALMPTACAPPRRRARTRKSSCRTRR